MFLLFSFENHYSPQLFSIKTQKWQNDKLTLAARAETKFTWVMPCKEEKGEANWRLNLQILPFYHFTLNVFSSWFTMICKTKNSKEVAIFTLSFSHFFIPAQRIPPHFLTSHGHFLRYDASFFTQKAPKTQIKTPCAACWNGRNKCE